MVEKEKIVNECRSLYSDIDGCIDKLLRARIEHNSEDEGRALFEMEGLMVGTLQDLSVIIEQLESEQPVEGLEEEVKRYYSENFAYISSDQPTLSILTNVARHFYELGKQAQKEKMHPIRVVPEDAWEISDGRVFAPKLKIVDDGCEEAILVRGFNEEFTIYKED